MYSISVTVFSRPTNWMLRALSTARTKAVSGVRYIAGHNQKLSDYVFSTKYARVIPQGTTSRFETWPECVDRVIDMYDRKYAHIPEVTAHLREIAPLLYEKKILPSGRVMQFAGKAIDANEMKGYNCSYLAAINPSCFSEAFYLLLCGTGVGFSVRKAHINQLPPVNFLSGKEKFVVPDTIEGWAEAARRLSSAAFSLGPMPEFDFSEIRAKGTPLVTSGGLAPGPEPLIAALRAAEKIFRSKQGGRLSSLDVLDLMTTLSSAVVSGGVRRSSLICLFDKDDKDMLGAKAGEWWKRHPNRALCNNSAVFHPADKLAVARFLEEHPSIFEYGEPGIVFRNSLDFGTNPCGEASLESYTCCNLTDVIMALLRRGEFSKAARAAAFLGTLYAGFTNFPFLGAQWQFNMKRDALIGVSLNGVAAVNYKEYDLAHVAREVVEENWYWANVIGINPAARTTLVKPAGTTSLLTGVPAGIHAGYAEYAVRGVVEPNNTPTARYFLDNFPAAVEPHLTNPNNIFIKFPYRSPRDAKTRHEPTEDLLERIAYVQENWVIPGHSRGDDYHNVSATVNFVPTDIPKVKTWLKQHSDILGGVSFIQHHPERAYKQAPFTEVTQEEYTKLFEITKDVDFSQIHGEDLTRQLESECSSGRCEVTKNSGLAATASTAAV